MEAVTAAVQDWELEPAYLGYGDFNARRNAKNFTGDEAAAAVSYCHLRGVKVFLTLNTLLTDRELAGAAQEAAQASAMGVDAVLVQDLGVLRMLRQTVPDLPVHASTQMTVHSLDGVKQCVDLGMSRSRLSRAVPDQTSTFAPALRWRSRCSPTGPCACATPASEKPSNRGTQRQPGAVRPALPAEVRLGEQGRRQPPVPEGHVPGRPPPGTEEDGGGLC